jgi:hypothetical protein
MVIVNSMSALAIFIDRLFSQMRQQKDVIEMNYASVPTIAREAGRSL